MKRRILFPVFAILVLIPLVMAGCGCPGNNSNNTANTTPIEDLTNRVAALESSVGTLANRPTGLTANDLADYAKKSDIPGSPDLSGYVTDAEYSALVARVTELEALLAPAEDGGGVLGEVTVVLDTPEVPYHFLTNATASSQVLPIKIINGTSDYQQVKFGLIMECVTTLSNIAENTVIGSVLLGVVNPFTVNCVPSPGSCQLVYFTWTTTDVVLMAPNKETIVYVYLNNMTTTNAEVWQISVTSIVITKL